MDLYPVIAANRCPIDCVDGKIIRSAGGLVTGLDEYLKTGALTYVGSAMGDDDRRIVDMHGRRYVNDGGYDYVLRKVFSGERDRDRHYRGFSNAGVWPTMHLDRFNLVAMCDGYPEPEFDPINFGSYYMVNRNFSVAIINEAERKREQGISDEQVPLWVHDYHLLLVPEPLRAELNSHRMKNRIGHFIHTPFSSPDILEDVLREPDRDSFIPGNLHYFGFLVSGLLHADLVTFHNKRYATNFVETVKRMYKEAIVTETDNGKYLVERGENRTVVTACPIGLNVSSITKAAEQAPPDAEIAELIAEKKMQGKHVMLGVDRLEYTKGLVERIKMLKAAVREGADFYYLGFAPIGNRGDIEAYIKYKELLDNELADPSFSSIINVRYQQLDFPDTITIPALVDGTMNTSVSDGMNLKIFEDGIAQFWRSPEKRAALYIGYCGAMDEFSKAGLGEEDGIIHVNPFNPEQAGKKIAETLGKAHLSDRAIEFIVSKRSDTWRKQCLNDLTSPDLPV